MTLALPALACTCKLRIFKNSQLTTIIWHGRTIWTPVLAGRVSRLRVCETGSDTLRLHDSSEVNHEAHSGLVISTTLDSNNI